MLKVTSCFVQVSLVASGLTTGTVPHAREAPQAVSPGDAIRFEEVADACPTFSWVGVSSGPAELLVYRVAEHGDWQAEPTLRLPLPAGAASWTPSAAQCFSAGLYAWSVRPLRATAAAAGSSEVLLFRVTEPLDERELRRALAVVRDWLAEHPDLGADPFAAPIAEPPKAPDPEAHVTGDARGVDRTPRVASPTGVGGGGNLKVTGDYLYDSPRTFGLYLGAELFASSAPNFQHSATDFTDFAYDSTGTGWQAYTHPRFPKGAHVTELVCYYRDGGPGLVEHFGFVFYKSAPNAISGLLITQEVSNPRPDEANNFITSVLVPNFDEVVFHNANDFYSLRVFFESSGGSTNQSFHGCRFVYTLDRASS
jgi:hypothetical protein